MATLTHWTLPLNPPNPNPNYLQFLTEPRKDRLYYTKHFLNIIGELNVSKNANNVREWVIPSVLFHASAAGLAGITYGPNNHVWVALETAHRLIELDPKTNRFTAYGDAQYPFRFPRHLMFDGLGGLWYTGVGTNGALIGRLSPNKTTVRYWDLPGELLRPEALWVDAGETEVWFTPINSHAYQTGAFLARLVPATNQLTYWTYPAPGRPPRNAGVAGDRPTKPTNIWFTYDGLGPVSRVFRFHRPSGIFFEYAQGFSIPRRIVVDVQRNAWISDHSGRISVVRRDADCGTIKLTMHEHSVQPVSRKGVRKREIVAKPPTLHSVTPIDQLVSPANVNCYVNFALPLSLSANEIQIDAAQPKPPQVYFTQPNGIVIGRLIP